jgi:hypothetical protein
MLPSLRISKNRGGADDFDALALTPECVEVTHRSRRTEKNWSITQEDYWPELFVSKWFKEKYNQEVIAMIESS